MDHEQDKRSPRISSTFTLGNAPQDGRRLIPNHTAEGYHHQTHRGWLHSLDMDHPPNQEPHLQDSMPIDTPSSVETSTPAQPEVGKRRRGRNPTACGECNRRKQKCNGESPCKNCKKRGVADRCEFPTHQDTSWSAHFDGQLESEDSPESQAPKRRRGGRGNKTSMGSNGTQRPSSSGSRWAGEGDTIEDCLRRGSGDHPMSTGSDAIPSQADEGPEFANTSVPPLSSERHKFISSGKRPSPPRMTNHIPDAKLGRFWRSHNDIIPEVSEAAEAIKNDRKGSGSSSESEQQMEENEAHGVGSMRILRGPWGDRGREKTFFGTSHFGPQLAAKVIRSGPKVLLNDVRQFVQHGTTQIDKARPYTLESQTHKLLGHVPKREMCDVYVRRFFERFNFHHDIVYEPDFQASYDKFWRACNSHDTIDLRHLALLLIILAFGVLLDHDSSEEQRRIDQLGTMGLTSKEKHAVSDQLRTSQTSRLKFREEESSKWSWAARTALNECTSFFGESIETVRAGVLMAHYLNACRRVEEAWTAIGTAIRAAQAQGLHVDGSSWKGMSAKEAELRRRLWAHLYIVDRSISLFLGRPVCIHDGQFTTCKPANLNDDELDSPSTPRGLDILTKTTFLILHSDLARIIGDVQRKCFNLTPRRYADVQVCEDMFFQFKNTLPPYFRLDNDGTDTSLDNDENYKWLAAQRQTLNSKFHLARISLHRPYLLRSFGRSKGVGRNPYMGSREALVLSALADLRLRIHLDAHDPLDRFKWTTVASGFNPATIIGILCFLGYRDDRFQPGELRSVLQQYIELEEKTVRKDQTLETELTVLKIMVRKALAREDMDTGEERAKARRMMGRQGGSSSVVDSVSKPATQPMESVPMERQASSYLQDREHQGRSNPAGRMNAQVDTSLHLPQDDRAQSARHQVYYPSTNHIANWTLGAPADIANSTGWSNPHSQAQAQAAQGGTASSLPTTLTNHHNPVTASNNLSELADLISGTTVAPLARPQEWAVPSDWDPTASGLPDSNDASAWMALFLTNWTSTDLDPVGPAVVGSDGVWRTSWGNEQ
ncbi:hypothetical protein CI109_103425 [Kwoniella shandongensis]|uniref:Uncharacterized protein n=1 Tax=Kwoniella shandongensis TaxID=1734106 RepID=A0A5M6BWX3_9TREE|nr:uncharacterized protein CI109_004506 [Kwoniella shandongensis]KAA5527213.1 hypothetical protein CI109_004506 [Kwoniella shandongensis]